MLPRYHDVAPGTHPFAAAVVRAGPDMTFNVAAYARQLEADFLAAGGRFEAMDFRTPADLNRIKDKVVINCTGYGARALWKDESIVPIRGQIVWLVPQADTHYGLYYRGLVVLARRDGIVVQEMGPKTFGWNDANEAVDAVARDAVLDRLKQIYA